jgi:threonine dehydrogenase-like Zn-dependent dehydrogenase
VRDLHPGDLVVTPLTFSDGTCVICRAGWPSNCVHGGAYGNHGLDGGQGERVRVPFADATLVKVPGSGHSDAPLRSVLALSDVAWHRQPCRGERGRPAGHDRRGRGDGAVGLSAVLAAQRLGAERIIALSRNPSRQAVAREFGATDIVAERGSAAIDAVKSMTDGVGRWRG